MTDNDNADSNTGIGAESRLTIHDCAQTFFGHDGNDEFRRLPAELQAPAEATESSRRIYLCDG